MDRRKLLEGRKRAQMLLQHPELPPNAKAAAKRALDHAEAALALDDAMTRKAKAAG